MAEGLKACPFCNWRSPVTEGGADAGVAWVECANCAAQGPMGDTEAEAVHAWNVRFVEGPQEGGGDVQRGQQTDTRPEPSRQEREDGVVTFREGEMRQRPDGLWEQVPHVEGSK